MIKRRSLNVRLLIGATFKLLLFLEKVIPETAHV